MKIYILPIPKKLQPKKQIQIYPHHNKDFGVEQDFYKYLINNQHLVTNDHKIADWHYLPIYWTRWHVNHNFAKTGIEELQTSLNISILNPDKTFTICQYDDGPLVELSSTIIFLASRKTSSGIDIPLLCSPHRFPIFKKSKKYLASFIGRSTTYPLRQQMLNEINGRNDVYLFNGDNGTKFFVRKTLQSQIALCPRGYGGSSFRFFEAMQLGVVPFLIGDNDTRPFKNFINWDHISIYLTSVEGLNKSLDSLKTIDTMLMGEKATKIWKEELTYQHWCKYIIKELELLR